MSITWTVHARAPGAVAAAVKRRVPTLARVPVVLTGGQGGGAFVRAACPLALAAGAGAGMSLDDARARCPSVRAVPCPALPHDSLRTLLREAFETEVRVTAGDEISLTAEGRADPRAFASRLVAWFRENLGVTARAAAAAHPLVARVAAHCPDEVPGVIGPGDERAVRCAPLVRLPWLGRHAVETLARGWAVFTAGDLADLPGAFALKLLGREGLDLHTAVRGSRHVAPPDGQARVALSPATNDGTRLRCGALRAIDGAWRCLAARGLGARRMELRIWRCGDTPLVRSVTFDPDAEDPLTLGREACHLLGALWARRAVQAVEVRLWGGAPSGSQLDLFPQLRASRLARLGSALSALHGRFGPASVCRASTLDAVPA